MVGRVETERQQARRHRQVNAFGTGDG
jgi:hypothetical protein